MDYETNGSKAGLHEILQVAFVLLDSDLNPMDNPFVHYVAPSKPHLAEPLAMECNGLDQRELMEQYPESDVVLKLFDRWFTRLDLPLNKRLIPLAHNWRMEESFTHAWMGPGLMDQYFDARFRDTQQTAAFINDWTEYNGGIAPFRDVKLKTLCAQLGVENINPHDAYCDAVAGAAVYKELLQWQFA